MNGLVIAALFVIVYVAQVKGEDKGKSLKEVFAEQQKKINEELLDGSFKDKIESLKGHPKMEEIRDKSKQYCERLFDALKNIINDAKNHMNDYRDYMERKELEDLYRDVEDDRNKCQYRFYF